MTSSRRNRDDDDDKGKKSEDKDKKNNKDNKKDKDGENGGDLFGNDEPNYYTGTDVPKGYPIEEYPFYKGYEVIRGTRADKESGASNFELYIKYTDGDFDTINDFYGSYLVGSEDFRELKSSTGDRVHHYAGLKDGYGFEITVFDYPEENYIGVTFYIEEVPTLQGVLRTLEVVDLPPGYPSDQIPIINGGIVEKAYIDDYNGKITYYITVYTEKPLNEVLEFYDSILDLENKYKYSDDLTINLTGSTDEYSISIYGYETSFGYVKVPMYYIEVQQVQTN